MYDITVISFIRCFLHSSSEVITRRACESREWESFLEKEELTEESNTSTIIIKKRMHPQKSPHYICEKLLLFEIVLHIRKTYMYIRKKIFHVDSDLKMRNRDKITKLDLMSTICLSFFKKISAQKFMNRQQCLFIPLDMLMLSQNIGFSLNKVVKNNSLNLMHR